jgi:hypothetical protein
MRIEKLSETKLENLNPPASGDLLVWERSGLGVRVGRLRKTFLVHAARARQSLSGNRWRPRAGFDEPSGSTPHRSARAKTCEVDFASACLRLPGGAHEGEEAQVASARAPGARGAREPPASRRRARLPWVRAGAARCGAPSRRSGRRLAPPPGSRTFEARRRKRRDQRRPLAARSVEKSTRSGATGRRSAITPC